MLKFLETLITFTEVPDEISLCINISNCPCHCKNCSEPWLADNIGADLTYIQLNELYRQHPYVTCICFMGGDSDYEYLAYLCREMKHFHPHLKFCMYSGRPTRDFHMEPVLDYYKVGPWMEEFGPLNNPNTNQVFYTKIGDNLWLDTTYKFQTEKI